VEFSVAKPTALGGTVKSTLNIGAIGLDRLGNPTIDTVLLGQNLSFVTPGQASAVGGVRRHSISADGECESLHRRRRHRDERSELQRLRHRRRARLVLAHYGICLNVMPAHSRSLNGVAKLAYGGHPRLNSASPTKVVDGRNKSDHDGLYLSCPRIAVH